MKNVSKKIEANDLLINVVEYAFVEWLIRRGIYTAFKSNYDYDFSPCESFRSRLRGHIRRSLSGSSYPPQKLVSSSFLFASTPEGIKFWNDHSAAWERFCAELQVKL